MVRAMALPVLFDAILFDLDGTLIATDRFWIQAARAGAKRAFAELALAREEPSAEEWMGLVGLPLEDGFRALFADLPEAQWRTVMAACEEEERRVLRGGGAALMPGADEALAVLRDAGLSLGIASNCPRHYLDHMLADLGLARHAEAAYCLDSPGVEDKAGMIAGLLADFGTRSAVFVGDRRGDRDAAWANGLPHVHCAFGFGPSGEEIEAEGTIADLGELPELLRRRAAWIARSLESLDVPGPGGLVVGVGGAPAAGKSLFARDAARLLRSAGVEAWALSLDGLRARALGDPESAVAALLERVGSPEPCAVPEPARLDADTPAALPPDATVFVEGAGLLEPELRAHLDRVIHVEVPEELTWRRVLGRPAGAGGSRGLGHVREVQLPAHREHLARHDPLREADLVLDGSNPLGVPHGAPSGAPPLKGSPPGR